MEGIVLMICDAFPGIFQLEYEWDESYYGYYDGTAPSKSFKVKSIEQEEDHFGYEAPNGKIYNDYSEYYESDTFDEDYYND
jgi:hypothetical protein